MAGRVPSFIGQRMIKIPEHLSSGIDVWNRTRCQNISRRRWLWAVTSPRTPENPPQRSVPPSDLGPRVVAGSVSCPRPRARNIPVSQVDLGPASWNIHRKILINSEFIRAPLVSLGELENLQLNLNLTSPNLNLTSTYPNLA